VCETVIQVHGGIGNTWDCMAHVYLRRALVSTALFGGVGANLDRVLADRLPGHAAIGAGDELR
jgi:alkylation response protein AidB-like acyl-CoA dehydrogenase